MDTYLPWWLGAAALALVTVGSCIVARRPLGVSGILARFVRLPSELEADRANAAAARAGDDAIEAALLAATLEAFGPAPAALPGGPLPIGPAAASSCSAAVAAPSSCSASGAASAKPHRCGRACGSPAARPTVAAHALFLGGVVAGGFLAAVLRGGFRVQLDLGPEFARLVGGGGAGLAALAVGGLLVGIGTSVSGGCSTGHGLSGCSRLQPAGVAATTTFFATAVACSLLLDRVRP
jgi:hypothetical protein